MARLTKKSYKRKRIAIGLSLFASTALVSTGFAAWIVSSTANAEGNGSVSMGQITDAALGITVENKDNLGKFSFGPLANDNRGIVIYDQRDGESEALSITIRGEIANAQYLDDLTIQMDEVIPSGQASRITAAVTAGYIVAPECFTTPVSIITNGEITQVSAGDNGEKVNMEGVSYNRSGETASFSYTISFKWGAKFEGRNPGCYFDREDYSPTTNWTPIVENKSSATTDGYYDGVADPTTELFTLWNTLHGNPYNSYEEYKAALESPTGITAKAPSFKVSLKATVK